MKSAQDIQRMRESGLLLWQTHQVARGLVRPGATTKEIDGAVEDFILANQALPLFKGVPGKVPFPAATCISVNPEVAHGIASDRKLAEGDIVSIDIGIKLNDWCTDAAATYPVGAIDEGKARLIQVTEECLRRAIHLLGEKTRWRHIARKIQKYAEGEGFSVIEELVGHGIGQSMWESPQVPNYYSESLPDFRIRPGLVIAIEPMINMGKRDIRQLGDHWTIVSRDGKPTAHFEHTVAVTELGVEVLTRGPNGEGWAL